MARRHQACDSLLVMITIYAGNAGDRNVRGMRGALCLGREIARHLHRNHVIVGSEKPLVEGGWSEQLNLARSDLQALSAAVTAHLKAGERPLLTMGRCAASIATLPLIGKYHPNAAIVWFDAHGDCNAPGESWESEQSYLGGLVITGAAGKWNTGLGSDLNMSNVILVGSRDLDPPERSRIARGEIKHIRVGENVADRLAGIIDGRSVYIHLDCDVLEPGLIASEYQVPDGLSYGELREAFKMLAEHDIVGFEISEYEDSWPDGRPNRAGDLITAMTPVLAKLREVSA